MQKKGDEVIQVWYKDTKIYEGDETALKKWLDDLDGKSTPNRKMFLEEELKNIKRLKGFEGIKKYREEKKLPEFKADVSETGTVASVEIEGKTYFGLSSRLSPESLPLRRKWFDIINKKLVPPREHLGRLRFLNHAEPHALMNIYEKTKVLPKKVTLYVDRETCRFCKNELYLLMREIGVEELEIYNLGKSQPITLKTK